MGWSSSRGHFLASSHPQLGSPWAPLHWLLGIASYGLFGVAVLHAALVNRAERQLRRSPGAASPTAGVPLLRLERLTYRFVAAGFVVLSAAIALGVWFTSPWRWDHKAVFSILGWVVFAALLGGRRTFGVARTAGDAVALCRHGLVVAGLRRIALRVRGAVASRTFGMT